MTEDYFVNYLPYLLEFDVFIDLNVSSVFSQEILTLVSLAKIYYLVT